MRPSRSAHGESSRLEDQGAAFPWCRCVRPSATDVQAFDLGRGTGRPRWLCDLPHAGVGLASRLEASSCVAGGQASVSATPGGVGERDGP